MEIVEVFMSKIMICGAIALFTGSAWAQELSVTRIVTPVKRPIAKKNTTLKNIKNPLLLRIQKDRSEVRGETSVRQKRISPKRSLTHAASR